MYEHKIITLPNYRSNNRFKDVMSGLESEGWEIISVVPEDKELFHYKVFLKREKVFCDHKT